MLFASGDIEAAAELMRGAMDLAPEWSLGWYRLGEFHEAAGATEGAVDAWRMARELDPADRTGAALKLQLAGAEPQQANPSSGFAETLFDQYAKTFDESLVGKLGYRVPDLLADAIRSHAPPQFDLAVDLGCGTGLMGEKIQPVAKRLDGYDISAEMLKKARARNVYDRLVKADLLEMDYGSDAADLVVAADVFIYLGALERVTRLAAAMLRKAGLYAFSVERHEGTEDFKLRPSRRYAHAEHYVRRVLADAGFHVLSVAIEVIRHDRGAPLDGLIVVARR
nr:methyltransferase domain-containing protein [Mesorhizobium shangrilense]